MSGDLKGKWALITGSTHNLGLSIAVEYARHGARVIVHGPKAAEQAAEKIAELVPGSEPLPLAFDLADPDEIEEAFSLLEKRGVVLDILVNNAAHLGLEDTPLPRSSPKLFREVLEVNVFGTHLCSILAARSMAERKGGAIVNISSLAGQQAIHGRLGYNTSKSAIDGMTRGMAIDLAHEGIRVNAIAPGYVWSDRWEGIEDDEIIQRCARIPVGVPTAQQEIADLAVFLASDRARTLTGAVVTIDGGLAAQQSPR